MASENIKKRKIKFHSPKKIQLKIFLRKYREFLKIPKPADKNNNG